jgi:hypothetical protein
VELDRLHRYEPASCDVVVGAALRDEFRDLAFDGCQRGNQLVE